jgi:uncharacterized membrane protein HdeD (DUF308 family)
MDAETAYEFGLGLVIVLGAFNYLYPGADFFVTMVALVAVFGVILFLKGIAEYLAQDGEVGNVWAGAMFIMVVAMLFGGLPIVIQAFNYVLSFGMSVLDHGVSYLASLA